MVIVLSGLRPGLSVRRIEMWPSLNGVSHDRSAKRLAKASAGFFSNLEMHRLMEVDYYVEARQNHWQPGYDHGKAPGPLFRWLLSMTFHNRCRRADTSSTFPKCYKKKSTRVLNGRTGVTILDHCIRLCTHARASIIEKSNLLCVVHRCLAAW